MFAQDSFIRFLFLFPELLIDGLARASPVEDPEACVYGYGAVRFLASTSVTGKSAGREKRVDKPNNKNKTIAQRLVRHGVVPLMILHLQVINEAVRIVTPSRTWAHI